MNINPAYANTGGPNNMNDDGGERPWHRWQDWVNLIIGIWLFIAPWIWHSTTAVAASVTSSGWNGWIMGIIVVLISLWALSSPRNTAPEWINAIAGIWLFIAPFVMGYHRVTASSAWNQWAVGVIVFVLAVWAASTLRGHHHTSGPRTA